MFRSAGASIVFGSGVQRAGLAHQSESRWWRWQSWRLGRWRTTVVLMGWMVCSLWVFVDKWSFWLKSWCRSRGRSEVILRSFGSRENWLNNDPWIHRNFTIWKSDPCLNSPERVGSSVFLVDTHFYLLPWVRPGYIPYKWPCLQTCFVHVHWWHNTGKSLGLVKTWF